MCCCYCAVVFDTGDKINTQLYQERYEFLAQGAASEYSCLTAKLLLLLRHSCCLAFHQLLLKAPAQSGCHRKSAG